MCIRDSRCTDRRRGAQGGSCFGHGDLVIGTRCCQKEVSLDKASYVEGAMLQEDDGGYLVNDMPRSGILF